MLECLIIILQDSTTHDSYIHMLGFFSKSSHSIVKVNHSYMTLYNIIIHLLVAFVF